MLKIIFLIFWFPYVISGTVSYVSDGETFHLIKADGEKVKIRVGDIDCPERTQAFGLEAKEFVINEIRDKQVRLNVTDKDRYGRLIARVYYEEKDQSQELLKHGFAWVYRQYSNDPILISLEEEAIKDEVGLWLDKYPVAPWEFRKKKNKLNVLSHLFHQCFT